MRGAVRMWACGGTRSHTPSTLRLDTFEKKAKEDLAAAVESARAYEDTKRLVDAKQVCVCVCVCV